MPLAACHLLAVPLPFVDERPCDIYQTELYGGGCIHLYYSWIFVFFVAMCASTLFEVREQVGFQIFMTVLRVLIILIMVATLAFGDKEADFELEQIIRLPNWPFYLDTLMIWRRRDAK